MDLRPTHRDENSIESARKRIQADDGSIGWDRHSEQVGDHAAGAEELARLDSGAYSVVVCAGADAHDALRS
jgi:hypothetical protein